MMSSPPPSASGWVKAKDSKGRTFYANLATRKTQWTVPDGFLGEDNNFNHDQNNENKRTNNDDEDARWRRISNDGSIREGTSVTNTSTVWNRPSKSASSVTNGSSVDSFGGSGVVGRNGRTLPHGASWTARSSNNASISNNSSSHHERRSVPSLQRSLSSHESREENVTEPQELPPNWEMMRDPHTGRAFYVDHVNRVTTWEHPGLKTKSSSRPSSSSALKHKHEQQRQAEESTPSSQNGGVDGDASGFITTGFLSPDAAPPKKAEPTRSDSSRRPFQRPAPAAVESSLGQSYSGAGTGMMSATKESASIDYWSAGGSIAEGGGDGLDGPPSFKVVQVKDEDRMECPGCGVFFSMPLRRRHHCRLCGDVFCDSCSNHRCELPLDGPEFEKPVRVCDLCFRDVEKGNYFTMRRYLSALQLFDPESCSTTDPDGIAALNVSGALASLASDLDAVLLDSTSFHEKITIPSNVLVPAIGRHLDHSITSNRAIRALSTLLALGSVVGDDTFAHAVYRYGEDQYDDGGENFCGIIDSIMKLLEKSGSDRQTVAIQEQAARALFYLSDPNIIESLLSIRPNEADKDAEAETGEDDSVLESEKELSSFSSAPWINALDVHRALRNMLDHAISATSPSLQRWAAASIRNFIAEDQRRACRRVPSLESERIGDGSGTGQYEAFTEQLVSTGGVMILCSLMGADDADTRAHATAALSATIVATHAIDASKGGGDKGGNGNSSSCSAADANLISAIVQSGGCGSSLSQLLLSADNAVAAMGCTFASSLVTPLLKDPGLCIETSSSAVSNDKNKVPYQEAAIALATEGCLPALIQILRDGSSKASSSRPTELKRCAMGTLAAISSACSRCLNLSLLSSESTVLSQDRVQTAVVQMEEEGAAQVAYESFSSSSPTSQNIMSCLDSASSQLREAAGVVLAGMVRCSSTARQFLQAKNGVFHLLSAAGEEGMMTCSTTFRGEWAPRCLGILDAACRLLSCAWEKQNTDGGSNVRRSGRNVAKPKSLDFLLEALDAGAVPLLSRIISKRLEFHSGKAMGDACLKIYACRLASALFGIANVDETSIGRTRLCDAVNTDAATLWSGNRGYESQSLDDSGGGGLITATVSLLQFVTTNVQHYGTGNDDMPLLELVSASLLAVGSMCGSSSPANGKDSRGAEVQVSVAELQQNSEDDYLLQQRGCCETTCAFLLMDDANSGALLPSMLIGAYGEGCVAPALRLILAVTLNGSEELHPKLAKCGILIPISDLLRSAFKDGDRFIFSACISLLRACGPYVVADAGEKGGLLSSVRQSIESISAMIRIPTKKSHVENDDEQLQTIRALKMECIFALEGMSSNASLWSCIASSALPALSQYLGQNEDWDNDVDVEACATLCAAVRTIQNVIPLPSHAVAAARCGVGTSLSRLVRGGSSESGGNAVDKKVERENNARMMTKNRSHGSNASGGASMTQPLANEGEDNIQVISLNVLRMLASHPEARRVDSGGGGLIGCGAVEAACFAVGRSACGETIVESPSYRQSLTKYGLELLFHFSLDLDDQLATAASGGIPPSLPSPNQTGDSGAGCHGENVLDAFVDIVARESRFIRALISTMLLEDACVRRNCRIHESAEGDSANDSQLPPSFNSLVISGDADVGAGAGGSSSLYGPPVAACDGSCAGYPSVRHAAIGMLFSIASYCSNFDDDDVATSSASASPSAQFWSIFSMKDERKLLDRGTKQRTAAYACAAFLSLLTDEEEDSSGIFIPRNPSHHPHYFCSALPAVRRRLVDGLCANLPQSQSTIKQPTSMATSMSSMKELDPISLMEIYQLPKLCLALCLSNPVPGALLVESVCNLLERIEFLSSNILYSALNEKSSIIAMLSLINTNKANHDERHQERRWNVTFARCRKLFCKILSEFSRRGILGPMVEQYQLRSHAIASLCDACAKDDDRDVEDRDKDIDEVMRKMNKEMNEMCMWSLVGIITPVPPLPLGAVAEDYDVAPVANDAHNVVTTPGIMDPTEATKIASSLGKTVSDMVIARFVERASATVNNVSDNKAKPSISSGKMLQVEKSLVLRCDAPEVRLLCSLALCKDALPILSKVGGIEALSLVASDGELSAVQALLELAKMDASAVLAVDGHISAMEVLADGNMCLSSNIPLAGACFELLTHLCRIRKGLIAISSSELSPSCIFFACERVEHIWNNEEGEMQKDEEKHNHVNDVGVGGATATSADMSCGFVEKEAGSIDSNSKNNTGDRDALLQKEKKIVDSVFVQGQDLIIGPGNDSGSAELLARLGRGEMSLLIAAFGFLADLVQVSQHRTNIFRSVRVLQSAAHVAEHTSSEELAYQATKFLVMVAQGKQIETCQQVSSFLEEVFCAILDKQTNECRRTDAMHQESFYSRQRGRMLATLADGLECVLNEIDNKSDENVMERLVSNLAFHYHRLVAGLDAASTHGVQGEDSLSNIDRFACNISTLFLLLCGNPKRRSLVVQSEALPSMLVLILMHGDGGGFKEIVDNVNGGFNPKSSEKHSFYWNAARTQSMQCIACLLRADSFRQTLSTALEDVLGETEEKTCLDEFVCALDTIGNTGTEDPVASLAAQRILHWIGYP